MAGRSTKAPSRSTGALVGRRYAVEFRRRPQLRAHVRNRKEYPMHNRKDKWCAVALLLEQL